MAKGHKRLNMNRISELPEGVLQLILTRMPIRDAAVTSVLSSKWRDIWAGIPKLVFDRNFLKSFEDDEDVMSTIYWILLQHRGAIDEFTLEMPRLPSSRQIDHVINFILRNGLEHLKLIVPYRTLYKLPPSLFSCNSLKRLNLSNCEFRVPETFKNFSRLTNLECDDITVDSNEFNRFIAACPMLRVLSLKNAHGIDCLEITSALQLEYLYLEHAARSLSLEKVPLLSTLRIAHGSRFFGDMMIKMAKMIDFFTPLAAIEDLELAFHAFQSLASCGIPAKLPYYLTHLRRLKFVQVDFSVPNEVSGVLCLIRSAPNLQCLDMEMYNCWGADVSSVLDLLTTQVSGVILDQLERVKILCVRDSEPELEFIKFLLAKSPVLKKMVIQTATRVRDKQHMLLQKLARFPCASGNAELIF